MTLFDDALLDQITKVARDLDVEPAALAAVAHIESDLRTHALVDGRPEPVIRFEGHYFDRRLAGAARDRARTLGLASPVAGAVANPAGQPARWALLHRAAAIDHAAAHESVSWGIGQVMGAHWKWLGYASVDVLVAEARSGPEGQLRLMARFIDRSGLAAPLRRRDWAAFARGYNGPAYARHGYHTRLAGAYERYRKRFAGRPAGGPGAMSDVLRRGASGESVRALQRALGAAGHAVAADGLFGPATEAAVRAFQASAGLAVDGIVGPATRPALDAAIPGALPPPAASDPSQRSGPAGRSRLLAWLLGWLRPSSV